jgi:hypothetical protein
MQSPQSAPTLDATKDPSGFVIRFRGVPDPARVILTKTVLIRLAGQDVPGSLSWPSASELRFDVEQPPLNSGEYRVTVTDKVRSLAPAGTPGQQLDGEAEPHWPTGDGSPGGMFAFDFAVA